MNAALSLSALSKKVNKTFKFKFTKRDRVIISVSNIYNQFNFNINISDEVENNQIENNQVDNEVDAT